MATGGGVTGADTQWVGVCTCSLTPVASRWQEANAPKVVKCTAAAVVVELSASSLCVGRLRGWGGWGGGRDQDSAITLVINKQQQICNAQVPSWQAVIALHGRRRVDKA